MKTNEIREKSLEKMYSELHNPIEDSFIEEKPSNNTVGKSFEYMLDFWKNREKLLKGSKYVIYEDDVVLLYQEGRGYVPEYMLWAIIKPNNKPRKVSRAFSSKFMKYWKEKICNGTRDNSIKLNLGEDFELQNKHRL